MGCQPGSKNAALRKEPFSKADQSFSNFALFIFICVHQHPTMVNIRR